MLSVQILKLREEKLLFSSFDTKVLSILRNLAQNSPRGLLVDNFQGDLAADLLECDCFSIHPAISFLKNQTTIEKVLSFNVPIIPYTVNDIYTAKRLTEFNINTFITDEPKIFYCIFFRIPALVFRQFAFHHLHNEPHRLLH
ncbi:MAG: glycerophosphodiester phosphodiesterase [Thalassobaculaceae bacterium]